MLAEVLKKLFDQYFSAPIEAWQEFAAFCRPVSFAKDEIIKAQNTTKKKFHLIYIR